MVINETKILLVEDDPALLAGLLLNLQVEGYKITAAPQGKLALKQLSTDQFDLMILDLMLPDMEGLDILKQMRENGDMTPTLILSARSDTDIKVEGLLSGADDYMTKPFELKELLARVSAILRRRHGAGKVISFGSVEIFTDERRVSRYKKVVHVTPREYDLLIWFIKNPNHVFSREALLDNIWHSASGATTRTVDNFVMTLRKKLDDPRKPKHFITVRGHGYRFNS
jgi:DNA-binding response OmpR family regulator